MNKTELLGKNAGNQTSPAPSTHRGCETGGTSVVFSGAEGRRRRRQTTTLPCKPEKRATFVYGAVSNRPQVGVQSDGMVQITEFHPSLGWGSAVLGSDWSCLEILSWKGEESGRRPCPPSFPEDLDQGSAPFWGGQFQGRCQHPKRQTSLCLALWQQIHAGAGVTGSRAAVRGGGSNSRSAARGEHRSELQGLR